MIQATEAIKVLTGMGKPLTGRLLLYDALDMTFRERRLRNDPKCPVCGPNPTVTQLIDYHQFCGVGRGDEKAAGAREIDVHQYQAIRESGEEHLLLDVREPHELGICQLDGNRNIPLGQLPARLGEIEAWKSKLVVCQCRSGQRSMKALDTLQKHGFKDVVNLKGGILAWGDEIDPSISAY
jgi:sulfur-carrier protein adenylyltransferase/sulfurtransferase